MIKKSILSTLIIIIGLNLFSYKNSHEDNSEEKEILIFSKFLENNNYKVKSNDVFGNFNLNNLNLKKTQIKDSGYSEIRIFNEIIDYQISNEGKYIKIGQDIMADLDSLKENILTKNEKTPYFDDILNLNTALYFDDPISIGNILSRNIDLGIDMVVLFDYEKNNLLYSFVLNKIKALDEYPTYFRFSLLWYNNLSKPEFIRKKLIQDLFNKNHEFVFNLTNFLFENQGKLDNVNKQQIDATLAYLLDIQLRFYENKDLRDNKGYELLNNFYVENDDIMKRFQNLSFFGYKSIEKFTKIYISNSSQITSQGIIQDKDGFTNLRQEKNAASAILEKVKTGSKIKVLDKTDNWWLVITKAGNKGYIFKTKIVSE